MVPSTPMSPTPEGPSHSAKSLVRTSPMAMFSSEALPMTVDERRICR